MHKSITQITASVNRDYTVWHVSFDFLGKKVLFFGAFLSMIISKNIVCTDFTLNFELGKQLELSFCGCMYLFKWICVCIKNNNYDTHYHHFQNVALICSFWVAAINCNFITFTLMLRQLLSQRICYFKKLLIFMIKNYNVKTKLTQI